MTNVTKPEASKDTDWYLLSFSEAASLALLDEDEIPAAIERMKRWSAGTDVVDPDSDNWEFLDIEESAARARLHDPRRDEAWDLTEAARDLSRPPGPQSSEPIRVRGDQLSWPIFWQGRQWAVTAYGVECRDGTYYVKKDRLWENDEDHSWVHHMAEKNWVDLPDFGRRCASRVDILPNPGSPVLGERRSAMFFTDADKDTRSSTAAPI
jgi:hypothetical protein